MAIDVSRLVEKARRRERRLRGEARARREPGPRRETWGARSPYRGVYPTANGTWAAKRRVAKRLYHLGTFDDEAAAARAYDACARRLLGAAARLNFPEGE